MNVAAWIVSGVLAALFLMSGVMKVPATKAALAANPRMGWAAPFPIGLIKFIGLAEIAGAIGLILPRALNLAPWLTPTAAIGLAAIMLGAIITHARRSEFQSVAVNVVLLALAVFVATQRF
ncbi:putative membrane protein YphA (DoxX/SURF4 family) [Kribbella aluminosa]|uniref:Membrane protein YphA (DoxX/SURF4 family) n=1 Tax=Kribbella aluminosa TaxID=416017 RepID=A0ABS4UPY7_9ACTN|nr:DoxX family protein [Kribbella aluminosa]MBP2353706.1 putative membrane protein YphA (DoxX/SURF4 family) [Kribbella aluminosa]